MTVVRRIARPLLAAAYVDAGLEEFRHPLPRVAAARPVVERVAVPLGLPDDPKLLVRANGAAMAGAGVLFALGRLPRLAALVMALTAAWTTYASHPFWQEADPEARHSQRKHFLKNLGLFGGVLLASVDTAGKPGLAWRRQSARAAAEAPKRSKKMD